MYSLDPLLASYDTDKSTRTHVTAAYTMVGQIAEVSSWDMVGAGAGMRMLLPAGLAILYVTH